MTKDQHLEDQEWQYRAANNKLIALDAAVLIQQGYTEAAALAKARQINENQQEAIGDSTGVLETLAEAQSPKAPVEKAAQTKAIAARLLAKLDEGE